MVSAIIVAAGKGIRMNRSVRKQYLLIADRPILGHTLLVFDASERIDEVFVVISKEDFGYCQDTLLPPLNLKKKINLVYGGTERQDSVYNGLLALSQKTDTVVIHDGVRPFVRPEELAACIAGVEETGACILGIPASDTLKHMGKTGHIEKTFARAAGSRCQNHTGQQNQHKNHNSAGFGPCRGNIDGVVKSSIYYALYMNPGRRRRRQRRVNLST